MKQCSFIRLLYIYAKAIKDMCMCFQSNFYCSKHALGSLNLSLSLLFLTIKTGVKIGYQFCVFSNTMYSAKHCKFACIYQAEPLKPYGVIMMIFLLQLAS